MLLTPLKSLVWLNYSIFIWALKLDGFEVCLQIFLKRSKSFSNYQNLWPTFLEAMFSSFCPNEKTITLPLLAGKKKICTLVKISLMEELNLLRNDKLVWEEKKGNLIYIFFQIFFFSLKRVGNVDRGYAGGISNSLSGRENEFKTMKKEKKFWILCSKPKRSSVHLFILWPP